MSTAIKNQDAKEQKEQRRLARFERELARPDTIRYYPLLLLILVLFNIFDQVSTNIFNQFDDAVTMFFAKLGAQAEVWVKFDIWGQITSQGADYSTYQVLNGKLMLGATLGFSLLAVAPFYKALADKYGRKPFFVINCIGLVISVIFGYISYYVFAGAKSPAVETFAIVLFILGQVAIIFFTLQDIQMLYIFEVVNEAKRATIFGVTKGCGLFTSVLVIATRLFSIDEIAVIEWQHIYLGVAVFGVLCLLLSIFGLRESRPFLEQRVAYLCIPEQEREKQRKEKNKNKIGVWGGLKTIFGNKQLKTLAMAMLCVSVANNMVCSKANSIMIQSGMSALYITVALIVAKALEALLNMIMGYLSDKFGRKPIALVLAFLNAVSMTFFCFFTSGIANMSGNTYNGEATSAAAFTGIMYGIALSSYLCLFDQIYLMTSESAPTYLRSSVVGCSSMFRITAVVALILQSVLAVTIHAPTAWVCYVLSVPFIIAAAIIIFIRVKETNGKSISEIDREFELI